MFGQQVIKKLKIESAKLFQTQYLTPKLCYFLNTNKLNDTKGQSYTYYIALHISGYISAVMH